MYLCTFILGKVIICGTNFFIMNRKYIIEKEHEVYYTNREMTEASDVMLDAFLFTEEQAEAIVSLRLYRLSSTDITVLKQENKTLIREISELNSILKSKEVLDAVLVNDVRGINGYTGKWKGVPVTVMASGMGMPSIGIYSYELFKFYDVDNIIRIGSAGSYVRELDVYDVLLVSGAYSLSTYAKVQCGSDADTMYPSDELNEKIRISARNQKVHIKEGLIYSSDVFYPESTDYLQDIIHVRGCKAVEMESFALFSNANVTGKNAA